MWGEGLGAEDLEDPVVRFGVHDMSAPAATVVRFAVVSGKSRLRTGTAMPASDADVQAGSCGVRFDDGEEACIGGDELAAAVAFYQRLCTGNAI